MPIAARKVVTLDYTLRNAEGEVLDTSEGSQPLMYLHGSEQIIPGLERALEGLDTGDAKDVVVRPAEGYGEHDEEGVFPVPRAAFPADLDIAVGATFMGETDEGVPVPVRVIEVTADSVKVDANHPLAGVELHYHVEVREVRDATLEELTQSHSHGPGCDHDDGPGKSRIIT